jgi:hypothetical protein
VIGVFAYRLTPKLAYSNVCYMWSGYGYYFPLSLTATCQVIACIEDPPLIAKILGQVRLRAAGEAAQARAPPADSWQVLKRL